MSTIEAQRLTKTFGSHEAAVNAVRDVSVSVDAGEIVLLLGPSGSGKTTLVSMLGGLLTPSAGDVRIDGVGQLYGGRGGPAMRLRNIGFVFQSFNLLPAMSALDNVALPLRLLGRRRREAVGRAQELLSLLGLEHRMHALPGTLSGGEKQRVSLARALVAQPRVLLADEPTASLDTATGREAMDVLRRSVRDGGQACVVVTHDTRLVGFADRVMHIEDGRVAEGARVD